MDTCEVQVGQWMGYPHWECIRCAIATTDEQTWQRRCQLRAPAGRLESTTGLFGPDGEPLPPPAVGAEVATHDDVTEPPHVGGGWYELLDGTRVQGLDNAIEAQRTAHDE